MTLTPIRQSSILTAAVVAALSVILAFGLPTPAVASDLANIVQFLAPLLAAMACQRAARRATSAPHRLAWRLFSASAASWAVGQAIRILYEFADIATPYPSAADVGYLLAIPLALIGVWMMSSHTSLSSWLVAILDGMLIAGGVLAISWTFFLRQAWETSADGAFPLLLSLAYPFGNVVVASSALLAVVQSDTSRDTAPLARIAVAMAVLAGADAIFVISSLHGQAEAASVADPAWAASYGLLMLAAIAYPRPVADGPSLPNRPHSVQSAALPLIVIGLAWLARMISLASDRGDDQVMIAVIVGSTALIVLRYLTTLKENETLTDSLEEKISELTAREEQLTRQAFQDPLTGLANRRLFIERVDAAIARSSDVDGTIAVLFIDLDDFKNVNDSFGHAAGDRLLTAVATRLSQCVRPGDTVARLGGDEFGILLRQVEGPDHAVRVSERILESLDVAFPLDGRLVFTRASIGLAHGRSQSLDPGAHLLSDADVALYSAKDSGKSTFKVFTPEMRVMARERLEMSQDLRGALARKEFFCHYQPIVDLVTGRIVGLEALARWDHPTKGLVGPTSFIELAEDTGLIGEIDMAVLEMAAWQGANWRLARKIPPSLEIHVNLSGRQLEDPHLIDKIRRVLGSTGYPASQLVLEITETVAVEVGARHIELLGEIRALGIRLAIDDFGTGYSSLNYLRALPVDILKIDRAFAQTGDGATDNVLLEAIVRLGHSLGIEMIAEGIELEEQAALLRQLGCRRAQGFLFHHPLAVSEVGATIAATAGAEDPAPTPATETNPIAD